MLVFRSSAWPELSTREKICKHHRLISFFSSLELGVIIATGNWIKYTWCLIRRSHKQNLRTGNALTGCYSRAPSVKCVLLAVPTHVGVSPRSVLSTPWQLSVTAFVAQCRRSHSAITQRLRQKCNHSFPLCQEVMKRTTNTDPWKEIYIFLLSKLRKLRL